MELKVWVDGIQRVVCGITEQTTVQEVVIALAQATGRTGRYTLVEKWKTSEKMLPPAEHPLQVLSNWGERAGEVQFVLRRTGASTSISGDDKVVVPERKTHRSSLPPQFKHKQKKEAILNRKEPKRKSLELTGSTKHDPAMRSYKLPDAEKQNETKPLPTSPKKALIPPAFLHQTVTSQKVYPLKPEARDKTNPISMTSQYPSNQPLSPKKKALMPPGLRGELKLSTEQSGVQSGPIGQSKRLSSGESDKFASLSRRSYDIQPNAKPGSQPKHSEMVKARAEFTRLVLEQHEHVNEQNQTLKALDDELQNLEAQAQRKEKSDNMLKKEIESLEEAIRKNEEDLKNEKSLQELIQGEDFEGNKLQTENSKYQADITSVSENIKDIEKQIFFLHQEIEREKHLQARKTEDKFKTRYRTAEAEVRKTNSAISGLLDQLKQIDDDINQTETAVHDKRAQLEALNRELRQVNLQQFIRQTGSKVTVLPPNVDKSNSDFDSSSNAYGDVNSGETPTLSSSNGGDGSGVWV